MSRPTLDGSLFPTSPNNDTTSLTLAIGTSPVKLCLRIQSRRTLRTDSDYKMPCQSLPRARGHWVESPRSSLWSPSERAGVARLRAEPTWEPGMLSGLRFFLGGKGV